MLYLNYCYREHFKSLLTSEIQFQPLLQQSLISLEQDLIRNVLAASQQDFYSRVVKWSIFPKCHGKLLSKQKRTAIVAV